MATQAQTGANHRNGAKSRGPITPEGKQNSSTNTLRHGLRAEKTLVLSNESEGKFRELHQACRAHFYPANNFEDELVHEIAVARWRLRRTWTIETNLLDSEMVRQDTEAPRTLRRNFQSAVRLLAKTGLPNEPNSDRRTPVEPRDRAI